MWFSSASVINLSEKKLKRVGESKQPCLTPTVDPNQSLILPLRYTALKNMSYRCCMTLIRLALMLYVLKFVHKAACQTLSKVFLKSTKTWYMYEFCWCFALTQHLEIEDMFCCAASGSEPCLFFSYDTVFSVCSFSLCSTIFNMILLAWLIRLIVR